MNNHIEIQPKNILVIGDIMLDTYFYGEVNRISPEAPVPVFRKTSERSVLGGAGNVAANLSSAKPIRTIEFDEISEEVAV